MGKRLCLFFLSDPEGIADLYVDFCIGKLSDVFEKIILFSEQEIKHVSIEKKHDPAVTEIVLLKSGEMVEQIKNGLDFIGWDELQNWDEVIFFHDKLMGPVKPLRDMFSEMDRRTDLDFWVLTVRSKKMQGKQEELNAFPRYEWIAFRKRMLQSQHFRMIWKGMTDEEKTRKSEEPWELLITQRLEEGGFQWDSYVQTPTGENYNPDYLLLDPVDALQKGNCPFFLKESFAFPQMDYVCTSAGEQPGELLRYLKNHTAYNTDFILEHLIRTWHQDDITRAFQMTYVLPSARQIGTDKNTFKVALVMHLYYMDLLEDAVHYAEMMPTDSDIYVITCNMENQDHIQQKFSGIGNIRNIRVTENRGRDVGSLLVATADLQEKYDLICFYHDKKSNHLTLGTVGKSFSYKISESVLSTKEYVHNLISIFEENPKIGMLTGISPNHGTFLDGLAREWGSNYLKTKELAEELRFRVPMSEEHIPAIGFGDVFWYRTKAMLPMFRKEWKYEDFPKEPVEIDGTILHAIERLYPFAVQEAGYLPGRVMPDYIAALEISNLEFYVREYNRVRMEADIYGDIRTVTAFMRERLSPEFLELARSANFPTQLRLSLKRHLPNWLFRLIYGRSELKE